MTDIYLEIPILKMIEIKDRNHLEYERLLMDMKKVMKDVIIMKNQIQKELYPPRKPSDYQLNGE